MFLASLIPLLAVISPATPAPGNDLTLADPPVRIWLDGDRRYQRGDLIKVRVKARSDGYLVALRVTTEGRIRILFPLDPNDDNFVRGGKTYEIRGRGGRESFYLDDGEGTGTVFVAVSPDAFHFDEFVRGDHWDYRVVSADRVSDPEAALTELVQRMTPGSRFDYDLLNYEVLAAASYTYDSYYPPRYGPRYYDPFYGSCFGCAPYYGSSFSVNVGLFFGYPHRRFYYPAYYCDPFFCDPFFYQPVVIYPYSYSYYGYCYRDPFCYPRRAYYYSSYRTYPYTFKPGLPGTTVAYRPRSFGAGPATRPAIGGFDPRRRYTTGEPRGTLGSPSRPSGRDDDRLTGRTPVTGDEAPARADRGGSDAPVRRRVIEDDAGGSARPVDERIPPRRAIDREPVRDDGASPSPRPDARPADRPRAAEPPPGRGDRGSVREPPRRESPPPQPSSRPRMDGGSRGSSGGGSRPAAPSSGPRRRP